MDGRSPDQNPIHPEALKLQAKDFVKQLDEIGKLVEGYPSDKSDNKIPEGYLYKKDYLNPWGLEVKLKGFVNPELVIMIQGSDPETTDRNGTYWIESNAVPQKDYYIVGLLVPNYSLPGNLASKESGTDFYGEYYISRDGEMVKTVDLNSDDADPRKVVWEDKKEGIKTVLDEIKPAYIEALGIAITQAKATLSQTTNRDL